MNDSGANQIQVCSQDISRFSPKIRLPLVLEEPVAMLFRPVDAKLCLHAPKVMP